MRYKTRIPLLLIASLTVAQDQPPSFAAPAGRVRLDVSVVRNGRPLSGLRAGDFAVRGEDRARTILAFQRDELPLDIVLLCRALYFSPGQREYEFYHGRFLNTAANTLVPMRTGDRAAVVSYGLEPEILQPFTEDRNLQAGAIRKAGGKTGSPVTGPGEALAIEYAIRMLADAQRGDPQAATERRKLIVMVFMPLAGTVGYADEPVIRRLREENIILSALDLGPWIGGALDVDAQRVEPDTAAFRISNPMHIAQATGGDAIARPSASEPQDLLTPVRQRYTLWIDPPEPGAPVPIKVDLSEEAKRRFPDAIVQARQSSQVW